MWHNMPCRFSVAWLALMLKLICWKGLFVLIVLLRAATQVRLSELIIALAVAIDASKSQPLRQKKARDALSQMWRAISSGKRDLAIWCVCACEFERQGASE
jgi:hypothetical protein